MVDDEETCLPVTVYNIAQGSGVKIGDSVAIPEPYLQNVKVNHKNQVSYFITCTHMSFHDRSILLTFSSSRSVAFELKKK